MNEKLNQAIDDVFNELMALSKEEFEAKLKQHENGDIAKALRYAWNPEMEEDDERV